MKHVECEETEGVIKRILKSRISKLTVVVFVVIIAVTMLTFGFGKYPA